MAAQHLEPLSVMDLTHHKKEAIRLAKAQEKIVYDRCQRGNIKVPEYVFDELIGKGSFGRVYKGRKGDTQELVAIKVIDIDDADYRAVRDARDDQIKEFNREIQVLKQAQDSGAKNMNQMLEAFAIHSQLWLICEYCPGGSVKTLMRATQDKLGEKYIIPIARELAVGLNALHQAGIVHRDIKAANVLIHEEGHLQVCDFGVAGVLQSTQDKRTTIIGTLHWMAPEMYQQDAEYSSEVDVWGYGCTLFECAVGNPPNADVREIHQIRSRLRRANAPISLPSDSEFSEQLKDLVRYTLNRSPSERPSMEDVLKHPYVDGTSERYPTSSLSELVKIYYEWIHGGGQRISLYNPHGAKEAEAFGTVASDNDEWNFSTTDIFEKRVSMMMTAAPSVKPEEENTPKHGPETSASAPDLHELSSQEKANFEERVRRGAPLANLFDPEKPEYKYETKSGDFVPVEQKRVSDLPLRTMTDDRPYSIASNVIDMGDFDSSHYAAIATATDPKDTIKLADAATIRANRSNSRLYRDSSADSLTVKPVNGDDLEAPDNDSYGGERPATKDFSFPPKEWTTSAVTSDPIPSEEEGKTPGLSKAKKHATMEWSFAGAMAAAAAEESGEESSPAPVLQRPPLLHSVTEPAYAGDFEIDSRPSTATSMHSAAASDADYDPFKFDIPATPADPTVIDSGYDSFYSQTLPDTLQRKGLEDYDDSHALDPGKEPVESELWDHYSTIGASTSHGTYPAGRPARIGDPDFPGGKLPSAVQKMSHIPSDEGRSGLSGRPPQSSGREITLPNITPPSVEAMIEGASSDLMETELRRLLGGFNEMLGTLQEAVSGVADDDDEGMEGDEE